jgi:hypothetical protein
MSLLELSIFGCGVRVDCQDDRAEALLTANYSQLRGRGTGEGSLLRYRITRRPGCGGLVISRDRLDPVLTSDDGQFVFLFEKDMTIELQKLRHDLYFLHSAAVAAERRALLIIAPSGFGKSTLTWGLLHEGFSYLSDELAPVDLDRMAVLPYPHAICLKTAPPSPYRLPDQTLRTSRTMHIPADCLPAKVGSESTHLEAVFFLRVKHRLFVPSINPISRAEAAARLFANALNPLAHRGEGLDGAMQIVGKTACFELALGNLSATCALVRDAYRDVAKNVGL